MKFDLVLFDLDGTISKSAKGIINCVQYALESIGIHEENMETLKTFIGPPLTEQFQKVYGLDEATSVQLLQKYRERYMPIGLYETSLYEGMDDLLKEGKEKGMGFFVFVFSFFWKFEERGTKISEDLLPIQPLTSTFPFSFFFLN